MVHKDVFEASAHFTLMTEVVLILVCYVDAQVLTIKFRVIERVKFQAEAYLAVT